MKIIKYLVVIAFIIGGVLWYFQYFSKPEDTVAQFAESINHDNMMQMVDLIDPEQTKELRTILKFADTFSDNDSDIDIEDDVMPTLPVLGDYMETESDGSLPNISVSVADSDTNLLKTKATVTVNTTFQYEDETTEEQEIFHLEKKHRNWHIMDIQNDT